MVRQLDAGSQQFQEQMTLHEQGTLFEITLAVLSAVADVDDLMRRVSAIVDTDSVQMSVKDNGEGFDSAEVEGGYGLENMRRRVERELRSVQYRGCGTEVQVRLSCMA